ncbi:arginine--tRNA ligase [Candidatus Falkowbacteria bacterium CG10_big_fil_rev_8_21_14_0_10_39_11]|uniref:Arginine--tRNA ligase n=1 Tax=Candidatus Falkowbacteria bacterium CG10_big_fil_rev_8_21_14_0_10_39_11 TaxID=1974565 RepID=A0A2H0V8F3_9BACT|nr:MAG: arginine--tRNA ligase [Candidatus Falkowbacteria bacterium CG10_big_fil_rev_8_21_14_0_10_39_11]
MSTIKHQLADELKKILKIVVDITLFTDPPKADLGEFALPLFVFAKEMKKNPNELATEFAEKINAGTSKLILNAEAAGPYLNLYFKPEVWNAAVITHTETLPTDSGGKPEKIMIEYSQPNTHKEFHVGHLRNACLGASIVNILRYQGQEVIAANYIGDTGVHVAKCLWWLQKKYPDGNYDFGHKSKGEFLGDIYAEAVRKLADNKDLESEVSAIHKQLESQNPEITNLWQKTKEWSMAGFNLVYDKLNVRFDEWFWESEEEIEGKELIFDILKKGTVPQIKESEGAVIADLKEFDLDVMVLIKSDGNVLYGTKDLPLGKKKFDKFNIDKSVYIVDNRQSLYLKQIFKLLDLLGYENKEKLHVAHDFVTLPDGAMGSRKGNVVIFWDLYNAMHEKLTTETKERHSDWTNEQIEKTASQVTLAALKFWMLKYENNSVIIFDMDKAMSVEGATGPYLLYTVARINSVLKKAGQISSKVDYSLLKELEEKDVIKIISRFDNVVKLSADKYQPSFLATYLLELAQAVNSFYHQHHVISSDGTLQAVRIKLLQAAKTTLEKGLNLLNIDSVEEM